ncbi:GntR family transcriptional regulator [Demequina oxidasica]|uniref:GntR family transcriptional regulator n=1 Tax=Demequina oxidasica TaxID=676199 RepID=UPI000784F746|nr:GntR family transcriptional regulator [Demequina oxidasica]
MTNRPYDFDNFIARINVLVTDLTSQGIEKLPPERELAARFKVSRNQVRTALARLEKQSRIIRVQGRAGGAFITETVQSAPVPPLLFDSHSRKVTRDLTSVKGVPQMLAEQGFASETRIVSETTEPAPENIAEPLGIPTGAPAISLLRLRLADSEPLSLERMYLNRERFPDLLDHSPVLALYSLLSDEYGISILTTEESIEVTHAPRQVAALLKVKPWSPLLALRRIGRDSDGAPVEVSVDLFRADRTRLSVSTTRIP